MEAGQTASPGRLQVPQLKKFAEATMVWEPAGDKLQVEQQIKPFVLEVEEVGKEFVWVVLKGKTEVDAGVSLSEKQAKRAARGRANRELK
jgi:hypothetical protein